MIQIQSLDFFLELVSLYFEVGHLDGKLAGLPFLAFELIGQSRILENL